MGVSMLVGRQASASAARGLLQRLASGRPCRWAPLRRQQLAARPGASPGGRAAGRRLRCQANGMDNIGVDLGDIPINRLREGAAKAAEAGAKVVSEALDKPKNVTFKGAADLVTDTDKASEEAIMEYLRDAFPGHAFLGEEGGVSGNPASPYLWAVDPLDGTTNFSHGYPSFAVSVAVLLLGQPVAAAIVEWSGGPHAWVTRSFSAADGQGATCNGQPIRVSEVAEVSRSLLVTGFGYEHDEVWAANVDIFKHFTDVSQGVRRLGAAAVDCCHVALGVADAYWEFRLKPWDMAAGACIVREAGGKVSTLDGGPYSAFSRSLLVSNGVLHDAIVEQTAPIVETLAKRGKDFSPWFIPPGYLMEEV